MKPLKYFFISGWIILFFISCSQDNIKTSFTSDYSFESLFKFNRNIDIPLTDSTIIGSAIFGSANDSIITLASSLKPPVIRYNFNKNKASVYNALGSGPFELNNIFQVNQCINAEIYVLDPSQNKILVLDNQLIPLREFKVGYRSFRLFTTDSSGNIYGLAYNREDTNAVFKFDRNGNLIKKFGEYTPNRILQETTNGGGIITDGKYIYVSYLGGHEIWKYDYNGNIIKIFDQAPDFFVKTDSKKLSRMSQRDRIKAYFDACKMWSIHYLKPGYILQLFVFGNPNEGQEVQKYFEVWNTEGDKIMKNVKTEKTDILATYDSSIVFINDSSVAEGRNPLFKIFRFNPSINLER